MVYRQTDSDLSESGRVKRRGLPMRGLFALLGLSALLALLFSGCTTGPDDVADGSLQQAAGWGTTWMEVGPLPFAHPGMPGASNPLKRVPFIKIGRFDSIALDPTNVRRIYGGARWGGLWRSDDSGASWVLLSEGTSLSEAWRSPDVESVAVDPRGIVYVAQPFRLDTPGRILRGDPPGTAFVDITRDQDFATSEQRLKFLDRANLFRIVVDEDDPRIVYAASHGGLWRYDQRLPQPLWLLVSSPADANAECGGSGFSSGALSRTTNTHALYFVCPDTEGGPPVVRSSFDHGDTWSSIPLRGAFVTPSAIQAAAASRVDPNRVYVFSPDSGEVRRVSLVPGSPGAISTSVSSTAPVRDCAPPFTLQATATDDGRDILVGGAVISRWEEPRPNQALPQWVPIEAGTHGDLHQVAFRYDLATRAQQIFVADDGGMYRLDWSTTAGKVVRATGLMNSAWDSPRVAALWDFDVDRREPALALIGMQDTGSAVFAPALKARGLPVPWNVPPVQFWGGNWEIGARKAGDGIRARIHRAFGEVQLSGAGAGGIGDGTAGYDYTTDRWLNTALSTTAPFSTAKWSSQLSVALHPSELWIYDCTRGLGLRKFDIRPVPNWLNILTTTRSWTSIAKRDCDAFVFADAMGTVQYMLQGLASTSTLWFTANGDGGWRELSGIPWATSFDANNSIAPMPWNPGDVIVILGGNKDYMYRGRNVGAASPAIWSTLSSTGLPGALVINSVFRDPTDPTGDTIVFATNQGVFATRNGGAKWEAVATGLPGADVRTLRYAGGELYAGTYGRGLWKLRICSPKSCAESPWGFQSDGCGEVLYCRPERLLSPPTVPWLRAGALPYVVELGATEKGLAVHAASGDGRVIDVTSEIPAGARGLLAQSGVRAIASEGSSSLLRAGDTALAFIGLGGELRGRLVVEKDGVTLRFDATPGERSKTAVDGAIDEAKLVLDARGDSLLALGSASGKGVSVVYRRSLRANTDWQRIALRGAAPIRQVSAMTVAPDGAALVLESPADGLARLLRVQTDGLVEELARVRSAGRFSRLWLTLAAEDTLVVSASGGGYRTFATLQLTGKGIAAIRQVVERGTIDFPPRRASQGVIWGELDAKHHLAMRLAPVASLPLVRQCSLE